MTINPALEHNPSRTPSALVHPNPGPGPGPNPNQAPSPGPNPSPDPGLAAVGTAPSPLALLLLGRGADPASERGVDCPGDLPPAADPGLAARAAAAKATLGERVFILGHHYQRDEVIAFADVTGDSFKLAQLAAARPEAGAIIFCGVHFMAESADILTGPHQKVILPDLAAGCSMADMATAEQVEQAWDDLADAGVEATTVPVSYMNSSAAIKAFTGRHDGTICTSSNARRALEWAFGARGGERVLFLPDQHLGRNTAIAELGMTEADCVVYDPRRPRGGLSQAQLRDAKMILWRGHCSVHGRFTRQSVDEVRARVPGVTVLVHPECRREVVTAADLVGSTEYIIAAVDAAPPGSAFAIGTELNLVRRLSTRHPDKTIVFLDRTVCFCSTMNRIDMPHLVWALESLVRGETPNQITVDPDVATPARKALDQMLALP
ncbi:quinolinate synthase NadA [Candidatus Frankia nodulisporulans]|uniref:quinolinate synthase NadA n=1 Tax=Candidatus Frankia nodulisporulans TaxID=2060052 RepID=UPI0013D6CA44|nr:quinolinate synthase NadA [Candidatus Frankia nodulisporulans]